MKIYTKTGDQGETSLIGGKRVPKHHHRIEAYGTVDELNSFLGYLVCACGEQDKNLLINVQERLFTIGSILASAPGSKMIVPDLRATDIEALERRIDKLSDELPELKNFVLPGGSRDAAICHVARCVCRRAERLVVKLTETEEVAADLLQYLNRLSDYLFVLSRKIASDQGGAETLWQPRKS